MHCDSKTLWWRVRHSKRTCSAHRITIVIGGVEGVLPLLLEVRVEAVLEVENAPEAMPPMSAVTCEANAPMRQWWAVPGGVGQSGVDVLVLPSRPIAVVQSSATTTTSSSETFTFGDIDPVMASASSLAAALVAWDTLGRPPGAENPPT